MIQNRNGGVGLVIVICLMLLDGTLHAASISWDGNGDANNDGNWSTTTNWSPDGDPTDDTITIPDVNGNGSSGNTTRTITIDSTATYDTSFTINQSSVGFTNRLLFAASVDADGTGIFPFNINLTAGAVVLDKGSFNLEFGRGTTLTLPSNTTLNSTGGVVRQNWNGDSGHIINSGNINLTAGTTTFLRANGDEIDNQGAINLSGGDLSLPLSSTQNYTLINKGTIVGDGSGTITTGNIQLMAGSTISGIGTLTGLRAFDLQATDHTVIDLSSAKLETYNSVSAGGNRTIEVGTETAGRFQIGQLTVQSGYGDHRTTLVDNYNNDQNSAATEHLEVNTLRWDGSNNGELDLNGLDITVNTAVEHDAYQRVLSNRNAGSTSTITLGGTADLGSIMDGDFNGKLSLLVQNGAILDIVQNVPVSYLNVEAGSGRINVNSSASAVSGGILENTVLGHTWSATDNLVVDLNGGTYTLEDGAKIIVDSGASLTIAGNVSNKSRNHTTRGLMVRDNGTRIAISGNYIFTVQGGRIEIDSGATVIIGGNFLPKNWWNGMWGDFNMYWDVDSSATPSIFALNGGGASTQDFEIMSNAYSVSNDNLVTSIGGSVTQVPFGTISIGEGTTSANVKLVNNANNSGTDDQQVARNLVVTSARI